MVESRNQFFPDDVDEQIEERAQSQPSSTPDNLLIQDLLKLYREDTSILQRVWEQLSCYLPSVRSKSSEWR